VTHWELELDYGRLKKQWWMKWVDPNQVEDGNEVMDASLGEQMRFFSDRFG
jgi:hypothetical protein